MQLTGTKSLNELDLNETQVGLLRSIHAHRQRSKEIKPLTEKIGQNSLKMCIQASLANGHGYFLSFKSESSSRSMLKQLSSRSGLRRSGSALRYKTCCCFSVWFFIGSFLCRSCQSLNGSVDPSERCYCYRPNRPRRCVLLENKDKA